MPAERLRPAGGPRPLVRPDLEWAGQIRVQQPRSLDALQFDLRAFQRVVFDFLRRRTQQRKSYFPASWSTQNIDGVLEAHSFR